VSVVALAGLAGLLACAVIVALTRSIFAAMMALVGAGASAALAAAGVAAPNLAMTLGVTLIVLAPAAFFAAGLAMAPTAPRRRGPAAIGAAIGFGALAALTVWAGQAKGKAYLVASIRPEAEALWLAVTALVLGVGAFSLLAFGERGAYGDDAS
jgi:hypothetical protein